MVKKFRKKPVVIEAIQFKGNNGAEINKFVGKHLRQANPPSGYEHDHDIKDNQVRIFIETEEGEMAADRNDWIIKGVNGEFYPCKPDIFEKTYEDAALAPDGEGQKVEAKCPRCKGEGVVEKNVRGFEGEPEYDTEVVCPECGGSGKESDD